MPWNIFQTYHILQIGDFFPYVCNILRVLPFEQKYLAFSGINGSDKESCCGFFLMGGMRKRGREGGQYSVNVRSTKSHNSNKIYGCRLLKDSNVPLLAMKDVAQTDCNSFILRHVWPCLARKIWNSSRKWCHWIPNITTGPVGWSPILTPSTTVLTLYFENRLLLFYTQ